MRHPASLLIVLALTIPEVARAQDDSLAVRSTNGTTAQMAALAHLQLNSAVRVHAPGIGTVTGGLVQVRADSVVLRSAGRDRAVPTSIVDSVWAQHSHTGVGAGVGVLLGLIVGSRVGGCGPNAGNLGDQIDCSVGHAMGGMLLGAMVGGLIGAVIPSWERRLPTEAPLPPAAPSSLTGR